MRLGTNPSSPSPVVNPTVEGFDVGDRHQLPVIRDLVVELCRLFERRPSRRSAVGVPPGFPVHTMYMTLALAQARLIGSLLITAILVAVVFVVREPGSEVVRT
jgi:hypothetical protein